MLCFSCRPRGGERVRSHMGGPVASGELGPDQYELFLVTLTQSEKSDQCISFIPSVHPSCKTHARVGVYYCIQIALYSVYLMHILSYCTFYLHTQNNRHLTDTKLAYVIEWCNFLWLHQVCINEHVQQQNVFFYIVLCGCLRMLRGIDFCLGGELIGVWFGLAVQLLLAMEGRAEVC